MKGLKHTTIWEFLTTIQVRAKANVSQINQNNLKIEEYLHLSMDSSIETEGLVKRLKNDNKELMDENALLLNLHQKILSFSDEIKAASKNSEPETISPKAKDEKVVKQVEFTSVDECVQQVVENKIKLSEKLPCVCDEKTIEIVYQALLEQERYEECAIIQQIRERQKVRK